MSLQKLNKLLYKSVILAVLLLPADVGISSAKTIEAIKLNNRAVDLFNQGNYAEAIRYEEQSIKITSPNDTSLHSNYFSLSNMYYKYQHTLEAKATIRKAIELLSLDKTASKQIMADYYIHASNIEDEMGNYEECEKYIQQALFILEKSSRAEDYSKGQALHALGGLLIDQNRYSEAEKVLMRAQKIYEKHSDIDSKERLIEILGSLAVVYHEEQRYDEAAVLYAKLIKKIEDKKGKSFPDLVGIQLNLSQILIQKGSFEEAERILKKALALSKISYGKNSIIQSNILLTLGDLFLDLGKYNEAEIFLAESLHMRQELLSIYNKNSPMSYPISEAYSYLADLNFRLGKISQAVSFLYQAQQYESYYDEESYITQIAFRIFNKARVSNVISEKKSFEDSFSLFQKVYSSKVSASLTKLGERFSANSLELKELIRKEQDFSEELETLNKNLVSNLSGEHRIQDTQEKNTILKEIEQVSIRRMKNHSIIENSYPEYVALTKPEPINSETTQHYLSSDEAIVVLYSEQERYYLWVITKTDIYWTELLASATELNKDVLELRRSLQFEENGVPVNRPFNTSLSYKIYQQTLGMIPHGMLDNKRISFVANGAFSSLPIGLLVTKDPSGKPIKDIDWLIKFHAVAVLPSIYSIKVLRMQSGLSSASKSMIAFADPIFTKTTPEQGKNEEPLRSLVNYYRDNHIDIHSLGEHLPELPNTREEVRAVGRTLGVGNETLIFGAQATETAVKQTRLDQYRIIYFATHGLVAGDIKKFSKVKAEPALVLTIPDTPTDSDDGLLQASEVAQLKLDADWAVLSACNTASSDGVGAEALSGLARAFLYAGARSLVVSHWDVSDESTKLLMTKLFEISSKNRSMSHSEALQKATLELISDAKTEEELHPRYWAPFVVVGDPNFRQFSVGERFSNIFSTISNMLVENKTRSQVTIPNLIASKMPTVTEDVRGVNGEKDYLDKVYKIIASKIDNNNLRKFGKHVQGVISFLINDDGYITASSVYKSSGSADLDNLIKKIIIKSSPMPPPPLKMRRALLFSYSTP